MSFGENLARIWFPQTVLIWLPERPQCADLAMITTLNSLRVNRPPIIRPLDPPSDLNMHYSHLLKLVFGRNFDWGADLGGPYQYLITALALALAPTDRHLPPTTTITRPLFYFTSICGKLKFRSYRRHHHLGYLRLWSWPLYQNISFSKHLLIVAMVRYGVREVRASCRHERCLLPWPR